MLVSPIVYVTAFYDVMARAAQSEQLQAENKVLKANQVKMQQLEESLVKTRQLVAGISSIAGLDSSVTSGLYSLAPPKPTLP